MKKLIFLIIVAFAHYWLHAQEMQMYSNASFYTIKTRVTSGKRPVAGTRGFLSVPGAPFQLATAVSDSLGNLVFLIKQPVEKSKLVFSVPETSISIEKAEPFISGYNLHPLAEPANDADSLPFYGEPDKRYYLDDYTRFSTIEEILIEYVPDVKVKKRKENYYFEVYNTPYQSFFSERPLVLLDGVPIFDLNKLMELDPLNIRKLEVVARKFYLGSLVCYGIVSFTTYDGGLAGYQLPHNALVTGY